MRTETRPGGQTRAALRMRETSARDYDRPSARVASSGHGACWLCGTRKRDAMIEEIEEDKAIVLGVPAGASTCFDCQFLDDEQDELRELITEEDRERFRQGLEFHRAESKADLVHAQKLVDSEDGKWGGA